MCSPTAFIVRAFFVGVLFLLVDLPVHARGKTLGAPDLEGVGSQSTSLAGKAAPAPVQDAAGSMAVYPCAESSQRDIFAQLSDFSSRAALLSKAVRIRDRVWGAMGVRRARPPEAVQIQILLTSKKASEAGDIEVAETPGGRAVRLRFLETEDGENEDFKRALIVAVVRELMIRPVPRAHPEAMLKPIPRWLVDALLHKECCPDGIQFSDELSDSSEDNPSNVSLPDLVARSEQHVKPSSRAEILASRCFLSFLELESPKGNSVAEWLHADPVRMPLVSWRRFFSVLDRSETEIHKAWMIHVAALQGQRTRISMTRVETETALERLLEIDVVLPGNVRQFTSLENFEDYLRLPGIEALLKARRLEFLALAAKAHFFFEPIILAYADLCADISAHRTQRLNERFRSIRSEWSEIRLRLEKVRDYLNWWESLPRSSEPAPELAGFYRELDSAEEFRSRVSKVLDGWEKQLEQNSKRSDWKRILEEADQRSRRRPPE